MKEENKESLLEKITSSKSVGLTTTAISALCASVTPLAAFTPFLVDCLAKDRHKKRIEKVFNEINYELESHAEKIKELSDAQYKFISESIAEIFKTINQEKLNFLKNAINNSISGNCINDLNTDLVSRVIRDISSEEAVFLIKYNNYKSIYLANSENTEEHLYVTPGSGDEITFLGLVNLGLIFSPNLEMNDNTRYQFTSIVPNIVELLKGFV